jgi:hypothetical protein
MDFMLQKINKWDGNVVELKCVFFSSDIPPYILIGGKISVLKVEMIGSSQKTITQIIVKDKTLFLMQRVFIFSLVRLIS